MSRKAPNPLPPAAVRPTPPPAPPEPFTPAQRAKRYRAARKTDGKVEVRVRVRPKHKAAIKQLEKELNRL